MRKKLGVGILIIGMILFSFGVSITLFVFNHNHQRTIANNRHELFCETLQPGMSIKEVSDVLYKTGNVLIRVASESYNSTQYSMLFTDKKEQDLYGGWIELVFIDGKYKGAHELLFEEKAEVICSYALEPDDQ